MDKEIFDLLKGGLIVWPKNFWKFLGGGGSIPKSEIKIFRKKLKIQTL
jgi:hypothetical protein